MAGWRTGYMVVPKPLLMSIKKIQDTNLICPPIISQVAAKRALDVGAEWCTRRLDDFARVRSLALDAFSTLGDKCRIPVPDGAFYMLLQLSTNQADMTLVRQLVSDFGVAILPGGTFGVESHPDRCSIRISYGALDVETVTEGIGRLRDGLSKIL